MLEVKGKTLLSLLIFVCMAMALILPLFLRSNISLSDENGAIADLSTVHARTGNLVKYTYGEEASSTLVTKSGSKCLTFEETLDDLIASSNQIFVLTPAKGAGSSMKSFTDKCVGILNGVKGNSNAPLNRPDELSEKVFTGDYELPTIITGHVFRDTTVIRMMENIPYSSLIINMHRDETDRVISAIRQVVMFTVCINKEEKDSPCVVEERHLIDKIIKPRTHEVGLGEPDVFTCDFYDAIEENRPQLVFMHYKQADKLQKLLAKYHCPNLMDEIVHANVNAERIKQDIRVTLEKGNEEVPFEEWLDNKRDMLEYTFALRAKANQSCRGKSRNMQEDLFSCDDEILQVTRDTSF